VRLVIEDDYAALSRTTAAVLTGALLTDRRVNMAWTAGATPKGAYEILTPWMAARPADLADVHFYPFDELPLPGRAEGVTLTHLRRDLYGPAGIAETNIHALAPDCADAIRTDLREHGGLDLMLMGLGADCHFCGNMPGVTRFDQDIYRYDIREDLPWYDLVAGMDPAPTHVVTMGAPMVLRARRAVLVVSGSAKAEALAETLTGPIGEDRPATILRTHPDLLVIADRDAAALLARAEDGTWRRR
jgi:6-phosphogluconolactonase/glucosamine-6-phosphate isomerase/deaminase